MQFLSKWDAYLQDDHIPMNGHVVLRIVSNIDENPITFSNIDSRPWKHPVHCYNRLRMAQPANVLHLNLSPSNSKVRTRARIKRDTTAGKKMFIIRKMILCRKWKTGSLTSNWYLFTVAALATKGTNPMNPMSRNRVFKLTCRWPFGAIFIWKSSEIGLGFFLWLYASEMDRWKGLKGVNVYIWVGGKGFGHISLSAC